MKRHLFLVFALSLTTCGEAAVVHVRQQTVVDGVTNVLFDTTLETALEYTTQAAPSIVGHVFTHWSIEPGLTYGFNARDNWGRALSSASYLLFEDIVLTANYMPDSFCSNNDGVADGWKIYWYGTLDIAGDSDTDGDGLTFAEELEAGTNPHFIDTFEAGGVDVLPGAVIQYNPLNKHYYVIRCEPEGALFATISNLVAAGECISTPSIDLASTSFAYWRRDGVRMADMFGRSLESVMVVMPSSEMELVAVCEPDVTRRQQLYWYGTTEISLDSDTDGDGLTFAEELEAGTNPHFVDTFEAGGVDVLPGAVIQYNPLNKHYYVIRCEPEGALFATISNLVAAGECISTPSFDLASTSFAYWSRDGVRMADMFGRSLESIMVVMPPSEMELVAVCEPDVTRRQQLYWYGTTEISLDSDTDGDGLTFAEELEAGTNPFFPDRFIAGGVGKLSGEVCEVNLQPYEQETGVVVDGKYTQMFFSQFVGNRDTSLTFGTAVSPAVVDFDKDGLSDLLVASCGGVWLYINKGTKSNPEYVATMVPSALAAKLENMNRPLLAGDGTNGVYACDGGGEISFYRFSSREWEMTGVSGVPALIEGELVFMGTDGQISMRSGDAVLSLNLPVERCVSLAFADTDLDGLPDVLASDALGRIWHYRNVGAWHFILQDKVWGGTHIGFAAGLTLATIDWENDGDVDCLCGTEQGKLMLLRDPHIGRPTSLVAFSGVDDVVLVWNPSEHSRVRGYRIYRSVAGANSYTNLVEPYLPLPIWRDRPDYVSEYDYKVSTVSRYYTAGNSSPTEKESEATDSVRVNIGSINLSWFGNQCFVGSEVSVRLSIDNSHGLVATGGMLTITYDSALLEPVRIERSGLSENVDFVDTMANGVWRVSMKHGDFNPGQGVLFTFVFRALQEGETSVALANVQWDSLNGSVLNVVCPLDDATLVIQERPVDADSSTVPPWSLGDIDGDGQLTKKDLQLLAMLKQSSREKYDDRQLRAGDFNGNEKLDNADYQALRARLREIGVL